MLFRSLAGAATTRTIQLGSRVEPNGMTRILVSAELSTSDPGEPENLAGVQELLFIGRDDLGGPVRILVRVPL